MKEVELGFMGSAGRKGAFQRVIGRGHQEGPQVVTRRGIETAVLVPIDEWNRLQKAPLLSLKAWLLSPEPRCENLIPERRNWRRRPVVEFE